MGVPQIRSATAYGAIAALVLVLGTSASSARNGPHPRSHGPQLVVTPRRLAAARDIAPGDQVQRLVELRIRGNGSFVAVYFRGGVKGRSILGADPQRGLQIAIDRCSKRWRGHRGVFSCPGRRFRVLSQRPLVGRARLRRLGLEPRHAAHLRLVLTLPAGAGNQLQAEVAEARYSFAGFAASRH